MSDTSGGKKERNILDALEEDYDKGLFNVLLLDIEDFIKENLARIVRNYHTIEQEISCCILEPKVRLEVVVKRMILDSRILNPQQEAKDQLEEIRKHIWIEGEKKAAPPDVERVASEWVQRYSRNWREYRLLALLYVFERNRDHFLNMYEELAQLDNLPERNDAN